MEQRTYYQGGGFEVSSAFLRTPRKTFKIAQIEFVSVQRPLLAFAGLPALGTAGLAATFGRYLYFSEILTLSALSVLTIAVASRFAILRVHSLALRDDEQAQTFGTVARLRAVRAAVEMAMNEHRTIGGGRE